MPGLSRAQWRHDGTTCERDGSKPCHAERVSVPLGDMATYFGGGAGAGIGSGRSEL